MRYHLRTLLIVLTIGPPLLAAALVVGTDSWPLFLALGFVAYLLFALAVGCVVAWAFEHVKKIL